MANEPTNIEESAEPSSDVIAAHPSPLPSRWRQAALASTGAHLVLSLIALASPGVVRGAIAGLFVAALVVGSALFVAAFVIAAGRSRDEHVTMIGVYFLANHSIEARGRSLLRWCLLVQVIVGMAAASLAPFTAMAFSTLVPLLGLGIMAFVGARYGWFPPHPAAGLGSASGSTPGDAGRK